jgi:hypothetical protein
VVGYPDGTFKPDNSITRAEMVSATNKMLGRGIDIAHIPTELPDGVTIPAYTDLSSLHWAYAEIIEASVGHGFDRDDAGAEVWKFGEEEEETPAAAN